MNIMKSFCHVRFLFTPITLPLFKCCLELGCSSWQSACLATRPLVWSQHQKKQSSYFWFIYSIFTCSLLSYPGNGDIEASGVSGGFPVLLLFSVHHQWKTCGTPKVLQDFSPWWWGHSLRLSLALTHFSDFFFGGVAGALCNNHFIIGPRISWTDNHLGLLWDSENI